MYISGLPCQSGQSASLSRPSAVLLICSLFHSYSFLPALSHPRLPANSCFPRSIASSSLVRHFELLNLFQRVSGLLPCLGTLLIFNRLVKDSVLNLIAYPTTALQFVVIHIYSDRLSASSFFSVFFFPPVLKRSTDEIESASALTNALYIIPNP